MTDRLISHPSQEVDSFSRTGLANLSETNSRNCPFAAAKSHLRHEGTNAQNYLYIFNDSIY